MKMAATFSRRLAMTISLLYMLILIPHIARITTDHFSHPIFLGAVLAATLWLPVLAFESSSNPRSDAFSHIVSFGSLVFILAYFTVLFALA